MLLCVYPLHLTRKFKNCGFSLSSVYPAHWFQFANDAVVISGLESENQLPLNHFTRWCSSAGMIIRVDQCSTFGMKRASASSAQYLPKLLINKSVVPAVENGNSFRFSGRFFNYFMDNKQHMSDLLHVTNDLLCKINDLPCHPKNKLHIYRRCILSKISCNLTIADISQTRIVGNLNNIASNYIRQWLESPISATLFSVVLSRSKFVINVVLLTSNFTQCQKNIRNTFNSSPNTDITTLWKETIHHTNILGIRA